MLVFLVHSTEVVGAANEPRENTTNLPMTGEALPEPVVRMRDALLEAALSGDAAALQVPVELNELPPMLGDQASSDAETFARAVSADPEGREILAVIADLLLSPPKRHQAGTGDEPIYVWPSFAAGTATLDALSAADEVTLLRLVSPDEAARMKAAGRYDSWRIGIAEDGVWHFIERGAQP